MIRLFSQFSRAGLGVFGPRKGLPKWEAKEEMVRPTGFEPMTYSSGGYRSIQLSYGRKKWGERGVSNPRPQEPQSCALPAELRPPQSLFAVMVRLRGLEPLTYGLEVRCSIQLSYRRRYPGMRCQWSGREDLNLRPPAPKAGALPGCATPRQGVHSLMPKNSRYTAESEYRFGWARVSMARAALSGRKF